MKKRFRFQAKQRRVFIATLLLGVVGYVAVRFLPLSPSQSTPQVLSANAPVTMAPESSPAKTQKTLQPDQELKIYIDPETGQFRKPPAGVVFDETPSSATEGETRKSATDEPLEFMSPMAGGGVVTKVRLRFRRPLMAVRDAEGNLTIQHVPQDADLHEQR